MLIKKHLYIILFLGTFGQSSLAKTSIDSLKTLLTISQNDSNYVDILNKISRAYRYNDQVLAIDYAVKAEKISKSNNYYLGLAHAYHNMATVYADKGNNDMALEYYGKSMHLQESLDHKRGVASVLGNMGLIYRRERKFDKALEYHNKSLRIKRELNDTIGISYSYGNIGLVYTEQGKYDKALIHFYNSLRIKESLNDQYGMANSYGNIGVVYLKIGNKEQAQVNLERALQYFEATNNKTGIAESLLYLGDIYFEFENPSKSIKSLNRCLKIYKEKGNLEGMANAHLKIGKILFNTGKTEKASQNFLMALDYYEKTNNVNGIINAKLALSDYNYGIDSLDIAKYQLKNALKLSEQNELHNEQYQAYQKLAQVYLKQENYYRAAEILNITTKMGDSLCLAKLDNEVTKIQMQHDFDNQLQEKEFKAQKRKQADALKIKHITQITYLFLFALLLTLGLILIIQRKSRTIRKKSADLREQQNQIEAYVHILENQKEDLQKANETKDRFLAIIGHDLRNPFNAITGFLNMVLDQPESMERELIIKYLKLIREAGLNAQSLLENLLEWALNQSGELQMNQEPVNLNYILNGNILLVKEIAQQKNINIIETFEGNPEVSIDKNMINTVVRNLLSNALKFTNNSGSITLQTTIRDNEVKISIADTGIGISKDHLEQLFVSGNIKKGKEGMVSSGLGLVLCNEFLALHQQKLYVESTPNIGTTFWFYLNLNQQTQKTN